MLRRQPSAQDVIRPHRRKLNPLVASAGDHRRSEMRTIRIARQQTLQKAVCVQDQSIRLVPQQHFRERALGVGVLGRIADQQHISMRPCFLLYALEELREERIGDVGHKHEQRHASAAPQFGGGLVGPIAKAFHHADDAVAGLGLHAAGP